jgi:rRNA-processing protein FCF1
MFPGVYAAAKKYPIIRCGHITGVPPHECIFDLVKQKPSKDPANPNQYYWVLTQDETLRDKLADLEHVPITYLSA